MTGTHSQLAPQPRLSTVHALGPLRAGVGVVRLVFPNTVIPGLVPVAQSPHEHLIVRGLGLRQIAQAIVTIRDPAPAILRLGVAVDVAHAASMVGLAFVDRRYRRAALTDATIAAVFALIGLAAASKATGGQ